MRLFFGGALLIGSVFFTGGAIWHSNNPDDVLIVNLLAATGVGIALVPIVLFWVSAWYKVFNRMIGRRAQGRAFRWALFFTTFGDTVYGDRGEDDARGA